MIFALSSADTELDLPLSKSITLATCVFLKRLLMSLLTAAICCSGSVILRLFEGGVAGVDAGWAGLVLRPPPLARTLSEGPPPPPLQWRWWWCATRGRTEFRGWSSTTVGSGEDTRNGGVLEPPV
jgi:hypothetical protein